MNTAHLQIPSADAVKMERELVALFADKGSPIAAAQLKGIDGVPPLFEYYDGLEFRAYVMAQHWRAGVPGVPAPSLLWRVEFRSLWTVRFSLVTVFLTGLALGVSFAL